jgi:hypothetical protein
MSKPYIISIPVRTFYVVVGNDAADDYAIPLRFVGAQCDFRHKWGPRVYYKAITRQLQVVMMIPLSPTYMNGRHIVARLGWTPQNETKLTVLEIVNIRADRPETARDYAARHRLEYFAFEEFGRRLR